MIDNLIKELLNRGKSVIIQTHDFPDPDAIAAAFGLQSFLSHFNIESKIVYCGHVQREALRNLISDLEIEIFNSNDVKIYCNDPIIIVDGCKWSKNVTDLPGDEIAVIDHHLVKEPDDVPFLQIEKETGASSTIVTSYFMEKNLPIPKNVATALKVGISRDTDLLTRKVTQKDIDSYHYLYTYADNLKVNNLLRNNIQLSDFDFFRQTIAELKTDKSVAWHYFKDGCETNLMGILGDFILSAHEISLSILFAKNNDSISISIRNENPEWNAAKIIRVMTMTIGAGGGHKEMAGGVIYNASNFDVDKIMSKVIEKLNG